MEYVLTAAQMKDADTRAISGTGIPSLVLMERAALACVQVMKEEQCDLSKALIVCGSGNNGGDGFAIARLLVEEGYGPDVVFAGRMESRSGETVKQMEILGNLGVSAGNCLPDREYSVIIDAVFGIGLTRPLEGNYREIVDKMNDYRAKKVAVDLPSGIAADSGKVLGTAFKADITITFAYRKRGQVFYPGCGYCGKVFVRPIGIPDPGFAEDVRISFALEPRDIWKDMPKRPEDGNKGTFGRVLMIVGSRGMSGAAYLSAKAAYASGAGLVRIYTDESNRQILQELLPEAVLSTYEEGKEDALEKLPELLEWADVVCLGCGLGKSECAVQLTKAVLAQNSGPCVIDADGLNILAERRECLEMLKAGKGDYVLTPHMKEMSRLTTKSVTELQDARTELLVEFTEEYPAVCVLKDARTLAARKGKPLFLNTSGCAAMAKAGAGDVLAGMTAGLMAQGLEGFEAAVLGVYLHGIAGEQARHEKGSYSVLARDIIDGIGMTWKTLEEQHEDIQQSACGDRSGRN